MDCGFDEALLNSYKNEEDWPKILAEIETAADRLANDPNAVLNLVSFLDLTSLNAWDTASTVDELYLRALTPITQLTVDKIHSHLSNNNTNGVKCASVCTYPYHSKYLVDKYGRNEDAVPVCAVAGAFPSGQFPIESRVFECELLSKIGVAEIDVVINRSLAHSANWTKIYDELFEMRIVAGENVLLKTILATGELTSDEMVYKAAMTANMAGSDFIKTSTGKEAVNATLEATLTMCLAIKKYYNESGKKVGFKAAGGVKKVKEALRYQEMVRRILGADWLNSRLFRIGASSLLDDIEKHLSRLCS